MRNFTRLRGLTTPGGPVKLMFTALTVTGGVTTPVASSAVSWIVPTFLPWSDCGWNQVFGSAKLSKGPAPSAVPVPTVAPSALKVRNDPGAKPSAAIGRLGMFGKIRTHDAVVPTVAAPADGTATAPSASASAAELRNFTGDLPRSVDERPSYSHPGLLERGRWTHLRGWALSTRRTVMASRTNTPAGCGL